MLAQIRYIWVLSGTIVIGTGAVALALYIAYSSRREIAYREKAVKALAASEKNYSDLVDNALVGVYKSTLDGDILYVNEALAAMFDFDSAQEMMSGKVIPGYKDPADRDDFIERLKKTGKVKNLELDVLTKTNETKHILITGRLDGQTISGMIRDITERKRAEEALRESEKRYRDLFESANDVVLTLDDKGNILEINRIAEKLTGFSREELLQSNVTRDLIIPEDRETHLQVLRKLIAGTPQVYEVRWQTKGKTVIQFGGSSSSRISNDGKFLGSLCILRDITERKQAEAELKKSHAQLRALSSHLQSMREEERKAVAREIHDELGQALTALKMDLFWLRDRLPEGDNSLLDKLDSMSGIADESLLITQRISTELRPELLDTLGLKAAVEWQVEEFQKRTAIECELTFDPSETIIDQDRSIAIYRVLQEALTNVMRHADATQVKVSLVNRAGSLELRVLDNGKGVIEKQLDSHLSLGLIGMRERLIPWGGQIEIKGRKGQGTSLLATVPLHNA